MRYKHFYRTLLPEDIEPPERWLPLCMGAWATMLGVTLAAVDWMPVYAGSIAIIILLAFPVAWFAPRSRINKWVVNWIAFYMSILVGATLIVMHWPAENIEAFYREDFSMGVLVRCFLWIMAFRAFAIRTRLEAQQTAIPALSVLILILVEYPTPFAIIGAVIVAVSILYLIALDQKDWLVQNWGNLSNVKRVRYLERPRKTAAPNSWQTVAIATLVIAMLTAFGIPYLEQYSKYGRDLQMRLVQTIARWMMGPRYDFSPMVSINLSNQAPPQSERVLFRVWCNREENWRQQVYAYYADNVWYLTGEKRTPAEIVGNEWILPIDTVSGLRADDFTLVRQDFTLYVAFTAALPTLFAPERLQAPVHNIRMGENGVIQTLGYVRPGQAYSVVSRVMPSGPAPEGKGAPALPMPVKASYLQLPEDLPKRVSTLAHDLTQDALSNFDKAVILQTYLSDNFKYDLKQKQPASGVDFVDSFLFTQKAGWCQHFATAMVIMCRTIGLPARYVTGFTAGESIATNEFEVREKDAHAWAEVFIEGTGWQSFDPTPPQLDEEKTSGIQSITEKLKQLEERLRTALALPPGVIRALILVVLLVFISFLIYLVIYLVKHTPRFPNTPAGQIQRAYYQMKQYLARRDLQCLPSELPLEYLHWLQTEPDKILYEYMDLDMPKRPASSVLQAIEFITHQYLIARFSQHPVTPEQVQAVKQQLQIVRKNPKQ